MNIKKKLALFFMCLAPAIIQAQEEASHAAVPTGEDIAKSYTEVQNSLAPYTDIDGLSYVGSSSNGSNLVLYVRMNGDTAEQVIGSNSAEIERDFIETYKPLVCDMPIFKKLISLGGSVTYFFSGDDDSVQINVPIKDCLELK